MRAKGQGRPIKRIVAKLWSKMSSIVDVKNPRLEIKPTAKSGGDKSSIRRILSFDNVFPDAVIERRPDSL